MSVKGTIFKELADHLLSALQFADNSLPGLKWVDRNNGQLQHMDNELPIPRPAILIEYGRFEWKTLGGKTQLGQGTIKFYLLWENYASTFETPNGASSNQDEALKFFEFLEQLHLALEGFSGELFTPLSRVADVDDTNHDNLMVPSMEYSTQVSDTSAIQNKNYVTINPGITVKRGKRPVIAASEQQPPPFVLPG
jgi:hypothetical protein